METGRGLLKRHNFRLEDINAVAFANFLGRQYLDLGLATSTVRNHFYACVKPASFKFNIKLKESDFLADIIHAMKQERPGSRGTVIFPKWSLGTLLRYLNSPVFEPLDQKSWQVIRNKLLILDLLGTGAGSMRLELSVDMNLPEMTKSSSTGSQILR